jgi:hypothetical protein
MNKEITKGKVEEKDLHVCFKCGEFINDEWHRWSGSPYNNKLYHKQCLPARSDRWYYGIRCKLYWKWQELIGNIERVTWKEITEHGQWASIWGADIIVSKTPSKIQLVQYRIKSFFRSILRLDKI